MPCALCDCTLDDTTDSEEHVIPNALGGRLKLRGVICSTCNSTAGATWDSDLVRQLNPLSLVFGIRRQRGNVPSQVFSTASGDEIELRPDNSMTPADPVFNQTENPDGSKTISIIARTVDEARRMLKGLKRKHPELDIDAALRRASKTEYYPDPLAMPLNVGGALASRSIVKSALCLAVSAGADPKECLSARRFLSDDGYNAGFTFLYDREVILNRPRGAPLHCVAVSSRGLDRQLIGFVEFFATFRIAVLLADPYDGPEIHRTYIVNPVTGEALDNEVHLKFTREQLAEAFSDKLFPGEAVRRALDDVMTPHLKSAHKKTHDKVMAEAFDYAWKNCGGADGHSLTPEHLARVLELVMQKLRPYVEHRLTPVAPPTPTAARHAALPAGDPTSK